ncbi:MAG: four helix bundle protein [Verrucomicrobiaceae bacterium]|nr:four helix bundle protein [Verrucomicrobiaceae bacterium]
MGYKVKTAPENASLEPGRFKTFEDLDAYRGAREFRQRMYAITRQLPEFEKYELASQIRRAAVSLTNNIAEGHGRYHFADQVRFFLGSRGSLQELVDDLNVCADEQYVPPQTIAEYKTEAWHVHALINGYLRYLRDRKAGQRPHVREAAPGSTEDEDALQLLDEALA